MSHPIWLDTVAGKRLCSTETTESLGTYRIFPLASGGAAAQLLVAVFT